MKQVEWEGRLGQWGGQVGGGAPESGLNGRGGSWRLPFYFRRHEEGGSNGFSRGRGVEEEIRWGGGTGARAVGLGLGFVHLSGFAVWGTRCPAPPQLLVLLDWGAPALPRKEAFEGLWDRVCAGSGGPGRD